jgi:hypothetical protein
MCMYTSQNVTFVEQAGVVGGHAGLQGSHARYHEGTRAPGSANALWL